MQFIKNLFTKIIRFIKKNKFKVILFLTVLVIGGLVANSQYKKTKENQPIFQKPQRETLTKILEIPGVISAKEKASMRFAAGGKVIYLGAKEGEFVKKYQVIASIDKKDLEKQLQSNLNSYMKERLDWEEQLDNIEDRTIDQSEKRTVDKNQLDLENSVISVERNYISITDASMTSPINGILVDSPTEITGVNLLYTDVFEIINPDTLMVRAQVDEADMALIKIGQKATITLDSYPDENLQSNVNYISYKSVQTSSGTAFMIDIPLTSNNIEHYRLGMNGDVQIELETKENALTIPLTATKTRDGKTFVDVKTEKNKFEEREIILGLETDEKVEVLSGLDENSEVLIPD